MRQKPVWTVEEIREMLTLGIDRDRLDSLHAQAMYSLTGEVKNHSSWRMTGSGLWPVYLDYVPSKVETGNSRKILNSSRILLSQFSGVVEPETRFVDKDTNQLRKECWRVRSAGDWMSDGGWDLEMASQYTAFRELGTGVVFHDELEDESGLEYALLRYFKATDVVYDRSVRNPLHAKWVCRRTPYSKFEALHEFGASKVSQLELLPGATGSHALEVVWLYEFFSVPFAGRRETYASFIGSFDSGNVHKSPRTARTPYLPCSWGVNFLPEGSRWPLGGAWLQAATQGLMNNLEAKFRKASDRQSMTAVDLRMVKGKNLAKAQETGWIELSLSELGADPDIRKAIQHIEGAAIDPTDIQMYEMAERQYNEDAGLTEQMRGNVSQSDRTLGEQEMAQAGAEQSQTYEKVQALAMTKRTVEKAFDRMKRFDRSPIYADIEGFDITLNDPADERTHLDKVFAKTGVVRIDPGSITMDGDRAKMARRVAELADPNIVMLVGKPGGINPEWYRDELMKAHGEDDPHEYAMPLQQAMGGLGDALTRMATMQSNAGVSAPMQPQPA